MRLHSSFTVRIRPIPPYSFELTVRKPAGWPLFSPLEISEGGITWTATHLEGELVGIKLSSKGSVDRPLLNAEVFTKKPVPESVRKRMIEMTTHELGADEDLSEFYAMARQDPFLKHAVDDLRGMHNTMTSTIFPDAVLAILLQMTGTKRFEQMMNCMLAKYGDKAEFDGHRIATWPTPEKLARTPASETKKTCNLGYRGDHIYKLSNKIAADGFPSMEELEKLSPVEVKEMLLELPGIGDYSADIINPHGGFPIDVWSGDIFGMLFFGKEPEHVKKELDRVKQEGIRRWGKWSWHAFFYVVQDLESLSKKLGMRLRLQ